MKNKFSRSVTAIMLTAALLITSQGVVTAIADDENYSDASEYSSVQTIIRMHPNTRLYRRQR